MEETNPSSSNPTQQLQSNRLAVKSVQTSTNPSGTAGAAQRKRERASLCARDGMLAESVFAPSEQPPCQFVVWSKGQLTRVPFLTADGREFHPLSDKGGMLESGVIRLPSCAEEYGDTPGLVREIQEYLHHYLDVSSFEQSLLADYVLATWVYDRFNFFPYIRAFGEFATGKSRLLSVVGSVCYKPIFAAGATTPSPVFRLIDRVRGTLVIDECDFRHSDASAEIVKILNQGYGRGLSVIRSDKVGDSYEPTAYSVYGPKLIANRHRFKDDALESRCLTLDMVAKRIRSDIPRSLDAAFDSRAQSLRNKLLLWRFHNYSSIVADESALLKVEPRLTQLGVPLYAVGDAAFREEFVGYLQGYDEQSRQSRGTSPQAVVTEAVLSLIHSRGNGPAVELSVKEVYEKVAAAFEELDTRFHVSAHKTGRWLRELGFSPTRRKTGYHFPADLAQVQLLADRYGVNFAPENTPSSTQVHPPKGEL